MPSQWPNDQLFMKVENGVAVGEPTFMSSSAKRGGTTNEVDPIKLGFLPLDESTPPPPYDKTTQKLDFTYMVQTDKVVKEYVVVVLDEQEMAEVLEKTKKDVSKSITDARDSVLTAGFEYDFGGTIGKHTLQTREQDRTNWLALHTLAKSVDPGTLMPLRDINNVVFTVPASGVIAALTAMGFNQLEIYVKSWEHKDAVAAADSPAEALDVILSPGLTEKGK